MTTTTQRIFLRVLTVAPAMSASAVMSRPIQASPDTIPGAGRGGGATPAAELRGICTITEEEAVIIFRANKAERVKRDRLASRLADEYGITAKAVRDIWSLRTWIRATKPHWTSDDHTRSANKRAPGFTDFTELVADVKAPSKSPGRTLSPQPQRCRDPPAAFLHSSRRSPALSTRQAKWPTSMTMLAGSCRSTLTALPPRRLVEQETRTAPSTPVNGCKTCFQLRPSSLPPPLSTRANLAKRPESAKTEKTMTIWAGSSLPP